ncbi:hypothetical protein ACG3SL_21140 (plasmid) [Sphingomonas sp. CJ20]
MSDTPQRVLVVTGAYPPDVCGVGDYTGRLMEAAPASWELFVERRWSLGAAPQILRRLFARRPTDVILQYPTQGYGWSLVPHLIVAVGRLTGRYRGMLALHEFSSLSRKARLALALASHFASHIVFTTEVERDRARAERWFSSRVPVSVIGILSNIPWSDAPPAFSERTIDFAYFGHIRPNKGLEDFLDVMAAVRQADKTVRIAVIGEIPAGYEAFADKVGAQCQAIGAEMILGLDDQEAGQCLATTRILYLPFRDGVSARRGSVLAGLGNGALIATRIGDATPASLLPAILPFSGAPEDCDGLIQVLHWSDSDAAKLQAAGQAYLGTTLPRSWSQVAALYQSAMSENGGNAATVAPC